MLIIPTIYIRNKKTVNIAGGISEIYREEPLEMAKFFVDSGAELLHIIDLDSPQTGPLANAEPIKQIIDKTNVPVEIGGRIRSLDNIDRYFALGAARVILGVIAYQKPDILKEACRRHKGKIATHIDVRGGKVNITGWIVAPKKDALDYTRQFKEAGAGLIIYSDTQDDGSLTKENIDRTREYVKSSGIRVVFQADVASLSDIEQIMSLETYGLMGLIIGKPIYEGRLDLRSAITFVKERSISGADEPTLIP